MAKTTAPLLSLGASGSIGGALTFATWKGRPYVRQLVTPSNPRSGGQVGGRRMMTYLSQVWTTLSAANKATWAAQAAVINASPFNAFVKANMERWTQFTSPGKVYPVPNTGIVCATPSFVPTGLVKEAKIAVTVAGALNQQWGAAIFRSPTGTFTNARSNCVGVIQAASAAVFNFFDKDLLPGTYFYDVKMFTTDGVFGADLGEQSVVVT